MVRRRFSPKLLIDRGTELRDTMVEPLGRMMETSTGALTAKAQIWPDLLVRSWVKYETRTEMEPRMSMERPPSEGEESRSSPSWSSTKTSMYRDPKRVIFTLGLVGSTSAE